MHTLCIFPGINEGEVTLCEINGRIYSVYHEYANISAFTLTVDNHPHIHIPSDCVHYSHVKDEQRQLFVTVDEPFVKRLFQVCYEQGFMEALQTAQENAPFILQKCAGYVVATLHLFNKIKKLLFNRQSPNSGFIEKLLQTRCWLQSPIRCIAWHLYHTKIAVATWDDYVKIYSKDSTFTTVLKNKEQKNIMCLAWRPLTNSEIAIGCETGIFIWSIDSYSMVTRPSVNNATVLYRVNHTPVVSLEWNVRGDILASAAAYDSSIFIWNVEMNRYSPIKKPEGCGNSLLKWSPNGKKLFSSTTGLVFRVWECQFWRSERWNLLTSRVQTACWSPDSTVLLFTTLDEPVIYALSFIQSDLVFAKDCRSSPNQAIPIYDLTKVDMNDYIVGGIPQCMVWENKGDYLAVLFQNTNYIALFKVSSYPTSVQLSPSCFIAGKPGEKPCCIDFQKNFDYGACLSIAWSSGRVQHFPIIYSKSLTSPNVQHL